jgi:hypothetical protein
MRLMIAAAVLALAIPPLEAGGPKAQCKNRCDTNYQLCSARAANKQSRKACKTDHSMCKKGCRG